MRNDKTNRGQVAYASFLVAWIFLLITAFTGALLRMQYVLPLPNFAYGNWLHAHSHAAFLGWVFTAFLSVSLVLWFSFRSVIHSVYLLILLLVANLGMLLSFPIQGYGPISIFFSSLHVVGGAIFAWILWREDSVPSHARIWLRWGLFFMLLSALGPLFLGPLAAMDMRDHPLYSLSLYWYLHFQYNGWFVFFIIAMVVSNGPSLSKGMNQGASGLLVSGVFLTYGISTLWLNPPLWVYVLSFWGAAMQTGGLLILFLLNRKALGYFTLYPVFYKIVLLVALLSLLAKSLIQWGACFPGLADLANNQFVIIAFLHLVFLGFVTMALILFAHGQGWIHFSHGLRKVGAGLFLASFLASQLALAWAAVAPGTFVEIHAYLNEWLWGAALGQLLGLTLLLPLKGKESE